MLLKRRTSQNIVWGGVAGCMPVLIGWSAVTGTLAWPAVVLFLVIFFWTPPHYWPLSMRFRDDYAAAGVPMLPVVAEAVVVARQVVALLAGRWWPPRCCWSRSALDGLGLPGRGRARRRRCSSLEAHRLLRRAPRPAPGRPSLKPMRLFHYSITYLTLLFLAVAVDPLLYLPVWR